RRPDDVIAAVVKAVRLYVLHRYADRPARPDTAHPRYRRRRLRRRRRSENDNTQHRLHACPDAAVHIPAPCVLKPRWEGLAESSDPSFFTIPIGALGYKCSRLTTDHFFLVRLRGDNMKCRGDKPMRIRTLFRHAIIPPGIILALAIRPLAAQ